MYIDRMKIPIANKHYLQRRYTSRALAPFHMESPYIKIFLATYAPMQTAPSRTSLGDVVLTIAIIRKTRASPGCFAFPTSTTSASLCETDSRHARAALSTERGSSSPPNWISAPGRKAAFLGAERRSRGRWKSDAWRWCALGVESFAGRWLGEDATVCSLKGSMFVGCKKLNFKIRS